MAADILTNGELFGVFTFGHATAVAKEYKVLEPCSLRIRANPRARTKATLKPGDAVTMLQYDSQRSTEDGPPTVYMEVDVSTGEGASQVGWVPLASLQYVRDTSCIREVELDNGGCASGGSRQDQAFQLSAVFHCCTDPTPGPDDKMVACTCLAATNALLPTARPVPTVTVPRMSAAGPSHGVGELRAGYEHTCVLVEDIGIP